MNSSLSLKILACPPSLRWAKDSNQILIVDDEKNTVISLIGIEASVWDWMMLGYDTSDLTSLLSSLCDENQSQAEIRLVEMLQGWVTSGLVSWQGQIHG